MNHDPLFQPLQLGSLGISNRIVMAPLTRCRAEADHVPGALMAEYYGQRASAGLIIAEATMVMEGNSAFHSEPGIYSEAQVAGWRGVTEAVHLRGGHIFLQLWHGGRACHSSLNHGAQPVAPSSLPITNDHAHTPEGKKPYDIPRELEDSEIPAIVDGFRKAAQNAKLAGFDGIEIHGANGYLIDQFLRDGCNKRSGPYGGSIENRSRFLLEILEAVTGEWDSGRVGVRISPLNSFNGMSDSDPVALSIWLARRLDFLRLAYLHVMRSDFFGIQQGDVLTPIRENYSGALLANMGYSPAEASEAVESHKIDAVVFGTAFIANPDLPARIQLGAGWNQADPATFYSPGPSGYTDYPALADSEGF
ncbi:MAG: alkene reductase [bacterium]